MIQLLPLKLLLIFCLSGILLCPAAGESSAKEPEAVVAAFNDALLEVMKQGGELGFAGRYAQLDPVIRRTFDLPGMLRISLGSSWSDIDEATQEVLLDRYTRWSVASYAHQFDSYGGERFEPPSLAQRASATLTVASNLVKPGGDEVEFAYRLRQRKGQWLIVDILVSGISQLALTRAQFTGLLEQKGVDGLLSSLEEQIDTLSAKAPQ